jgi:hypothetical protein
MQEAEDIANRVAPQASSISVKGGTYLRWAPGSGEELWLLRNRRGALIGLNPHFTGSSSVRVGLLERIRRPEDTRLDGAFFGWVDPDQEPDDGACQVVFECPDAATHAALKLPAIATAQIAAFARSIEVHESRGRSSTPRRGRTSRSLRSPSCLPACLPTSSNRLDSAAAGNSVRRRRSSQPTSSTARCARTRLPATTTCGQPWGHSAVCTTSSPIRNCWPRRLLPVRS